MPRTRIGTGLRMPDGNLVVVWVDDEIERLSRYLNHARILQSLSVITATTTAGAQDKLQRSGQAPDLIVLDVLGQDGSNLVEDALETPVLVQTPWLVVSDLARDQCLPTKPDAMAASSAIVRILRESPATFVSLIEQVAEEFARSQLHPARPMLQFLVHDARHALALARDTLFDIRVRDGSDPRLAEVDHALEDLHTWLDRIKLQ